MDIRHYLNIITENAKVVKEKDELSGNMQVMSLDQFLEKSGVEPEGEVNEAEKQLSLFKSKDLPKTPVKKELDMGKWFEKYLENEDYNRHSENVLHVAKLVGSPEDIKAASEILRQHERMGHMPPDLMDQRAALDKRLYPLAIEMFNDWAQKNPKKAAQLEKKYGGLMEAKLGGVSARPFGGKELEDYLDRVVSKEKEKTDKYKMPYIHRSNIPIVDEKGKKYDTEALMREISTRPPKILKQNEKMQHSDGTSSIFYNVGLPALTGLAVDEDKGEFVIINTCPGAGACKTYCYAMKGGYVQWKSVSLGQSRLLNWLYNDPDGFMAQLDAEISKAERTYGKKGTKVVIRWHDAGDFFSPEYLDRAYALAKQHPDVDFYAYTKLASVAQADRPENFKMNYSMGAKGSEEKKIDFQKTKNSRVVPRELFTDLIAKDGAKLVKDEKGRMQFKSKQDLDAFKQRIAAKYSVKPESILTYDQMMDMPVGKEPNKYNVIVMPGDGDDGANRSDILNSFLLMH